MVSNLKCFNCTAEESKHTKGHLKNRDVMTKLNRFYCCHPNHNQDENGNVNTMGCGNPKCFKYTKQYKNEQ